MSCTLWNNYYCGTNSWPSQNEGYFMSSNIRRGEDDLLCMLVFFCSFFKSSSLLQKTPLLKCPIISLACNSVTLWHHSRSPCLHILCLAASLAYKNWFSTATLFVISSAGSGMGDLTNQSRPGIQEGGLKETGAETDTGGIQSCSTGQYKKTDVVLEHCKHVNLL